MLNNVKKISTKALLFTCGNISTVLSTALAVYMSAEQHLQSGHKNGKPTNADIINIAIVPIMALCGIIQAYNDVQKTIPHSLEGKNHRLALIADAPEEEARRLRAFVKDQKKAIHFSLSEVFVVQALLTLTIILAAKLANLSGKARLTLDTFFYTLEALDYVYNLHLLQKSKALCTETFQPAGLHPALQRMPVAGALPIGNVVPGPEMNGEGMIDDQAPAVVIPQTRRRLSLFETGFNLLTAPRGNVIANLPDVIAEGDEENGDSLSSISSISSPSSSSNASQNSNVSSTPPRDVIQYDISSDSDDEDVSANSWTSKSKESPPKEGDNRRASLVVKSR